jgi:hypothetical protein
MSETPKIYPAISAIMGEIEAVGKNRNNAQQNYKYRGIDDVYLAVNAALVKHGVFTVPEVLDMKREERPSKSGGVLFTTVLTMKYTFFASDGSNVQTVVIGEGMDSGDKASNKAMSVAQKYAFIQIFSIPTEEPKDPEIDSPEPIHRPVNVPAPIPATPAVSPQSVLPGDYITPFGAGKKGKPIKDLTDGELQKGIAWCSARGLYPEWCDNATAYLANPDLTLDGKSA